MQTRLCVSRFSTTNLSPHNSKHQKLWRHKSNIMSHQTLDGVLSWPKYFHLPDVSVSPILVIADNCQLDKVSFERLAAAGNKALVCCCFKIHVIGKSQDQRRQSKRFLRNLKPFLHILLACMQLAKQSASRLMPDAWLESPDFWDL